MRRPRCALLVFGGTGAWLSLALFLAISGRLHPEASTMTLLWFAAFIGFGLWIGPQPEEGR